MLGAAVTWNISNVGAIASVMGASYGVSLAAVGLLTTGLFATHLAVQIPGGRLIDRVGARGIGLASLAVVAAANGLALLDSSLELGLAARVVMGIGTGAGFVAGIDLVRSGKGGPFWQGAYGGATMAAGGLALMVVPQLVGSLGWRAPYWTGLVLALARRAPRSRRTNRRRPQTRGATRDAATRRDRRPPALAARGGADRDLRALGRGGKLDRDAARARGPRAQHLGRGRRARALRGRRHPAGGWARGSPRPAQRLEARRGQPDRGLRRRARARRRTAARRRGARRPGRRPRGRIPVRRRLRHDAPHPPRRASGSRRLRQRRRRARDPRLHAARRPHVQPSGRRQARLPRDRPRAGRPRSSPSGRPRAL